VQAAVGNDARDMQEVMARMSAAVEKDTIETLTMTVGTQVSGVWVALAECVTFKAWQVIQRQLSLGATGPC
jgi:hypothetical protein